MIYVDIPDEEARRAIFEIQLRKIPVSEDVDRDWLAISSAGLSGAEVVSLCQEGVYFDPPP